MKSLRAFGDPKLSSRFAIDNIASEIVQERLRNQKSNHRIFVLRSEARIIVVKLIRACGGCLGAKRMGVEGCDKPGEAVKRALIPGYPNEPRELKHLSTWRKRKKNRLPE